MNAPEPIVSVLITAHNAAETIERTLMSVALAAEGTSEPFELILVDDRSGDGTADLAHGLGIEVLRVLTIGDYEPGFLTARQFALQRGFDAARGEFIFLTDADGIVSTDWIRIGLAALRSSGCDALGAPVRFSPAGSLLADLQSIDSLYYMQVCDLLNRLGRCSGILFGNFAVRREIAERAGGLGGDSFSLTEDLSFARALKRVGANLCLQPSPKVEVNACQGWFEFVDRAKRTSRGGLSSLAMVIGVWMASLLGLIAGVIFLPDLLLPWLCARYGLGVLFTAVAMGRARTGRLLPGALFYEIAATTIGLWVLIRGVGRPKVRWGGVVYDPGRR